MNFRKLLFFLWNQKINRIKQLKKLVNAKDINGAYRLGLRLLKKYPRNTEVLYMTAWAAFQLKDFQQTIGLIERTLKRNPLNIKPTCAGGCAAGWTSWTACWSSCCAWLWRGPRPRSTC